MSDYVKEAARSLSPQSDFNLNPDLSRSSANRRRLVALSARTFAAGSPSADSSSLLGDAFAEVFASMAAASPPPVQHSDTTNQEPQDLDQESLDSNERSQQDQPDESNLAAKADAAPVNADTANSAAVSEEKRFQVDEHAVDEDHESELDSDSYLTIQNHAQDDSIAAQTDSATASTAAVPTIAAAAVAESAEEGASNTIGPNDLPRETSTSSPSVAEETAKASSGFTHQSDGGTSTGRDSNQPAEDAALTAEQQSSADQHPGEQENSQDRRRYSNDDKSGRQNGGNGLAAKSATPATESNSNQPIDASADTIRESTSPVNSPASIPAVRESAAGAAISAVAATVAGGSAAATPTAVSTANHAVGGASNNAVSGTSATASASPSDSLLPAGPETSNRPDAAAAKSAKGSADSANTTDMLTRIKLVQRVSRAFQHLGPEGGVVRLRLAPAELGTVRVEMQIQNKKVEARVVAETESASHALREHLPDLRARLEGYGMSVERLEVETESDLNSSLADERGSQGENDQQRRSTPQRNTPRETQDVSRPIAAFVPRPGTSLHQAAGVDIQV
jgi:flagellar hook-length control protein FliK